MHCSRCGFDFCWCCMTSHDTESLDFENFPFHVCFSLEYSMMTNMILLMLMILLMPILTVVVLPILAFCGMVTVVPISQLIGICKMPKRGKKICCFMFYPLLWAIEVSIATLIMVVLYPLVILLGLVLQAYMYKHIGILILSISG